MENPTGFLSKELGYENLQVGLQKHIVTAVLYWLDNEKWVLHARMELSACRGLQILEICAIIAVNNIHLWIGHNNA